jgi:hypothetical protein
MTTHESGGSLTTLLSTFGNVIAHIDLPLLAIPSHGQHWQKAALMEGKGLRTVITPDDLRDINSAVKRLLSIGFN